MELPSSRSSMEALQVRSFAVLLLLKDTSKVRGRPRCLFDYIARHRRVLWPHNSIPCSYRLMCSLTSAFSTRPGLPLQRRDLPPPPAASCCRAASPSRLFKPSCRMESELRKLKVAELRDQLQSRGLDTKGVKDELVARLAEAMTAEEAAPAANGGAEAAPAEPAAQEAAGQEPAEVGVCEQRRRQLPLFVTHATVALLRLSWAYSALSCQHLVPIARRPQLQQTLERQGRVRHPPARQRLSRLQPPAQSPPLQRPMPSQS